MFFHETGLMLARRLRYVFGQLFPCQMIPIIWSYRNISESRGYSASPDAQTVNLLSFEKSSSVPLTHVGVGHEVESVFCADNTAKLTVGTVEVVFPGEAVQSPERRRCGGVSAFQ
jgi:hypothetical protein